MIDRIENLQHRYVPRVLSLIGDADVCNVWRTWWPSGFLTARGFVADWCRYDDFHSRLPLLEAGRYNVLVTPRIAFGSDSVYRNWLSTVRSLGVTWVYDADDDLWSQDYVDLQTRLPMLSETRSEYERQRAQRVALIQSADGLTVTTDALARRARESTAMPVHVAANLINVAAFKYAQQQIPRSIPPLTIGWSGTPREDSDLTALGLGWTEIARRFPDVRFIVQGYPSPALCGSVPADRLTILPGCGTAEYPGMLGNIDIFCCAVADTPWNAMKSPIKWMEATLAGAACAVSQALYGQYVEDHQTGLVVRHSLEWADALATLVEDAALRNRLQATASDRVVTNWSLENHWYSWITAWSAILQTRSRGSYATR